MALTDTVVRRAKPAIKPYKLADAGGLFLTVMATGGKLWRWKYRFDSKEKLMALGSYPDVSLAAARERHAEGDGSWRWSVWVTKGQMTGHGFRGIASTVLHEQGYDHQHYCLSLGHITDAQRALA